MQPLVVLYMETTFVKIQISFNKDKHLFSLKCWNKLNPLRFSQYISFSHSLEIPTIKEQLSETTRLKKLCQTEFLLILESSSNDINEGDTFSREHLCQAPNVKKECYITSKQFPLLFFIYREQSCQIKATICCTKDTLWELLGRSYLDHFPLK